jgi:hypothetical protein
VYYVLRYDGFSETEALPLPRPALPVADMTFNNGVLVADPPERITFTMTKEEKGDLGDWVPTGLPGLVISKKFRQALEGAGVDNVQYIPAEIRDAVDKRSYTDYFVANVIGVVDCIDMAQSKLTMRAALPDKIRDINELHIDEKRAATHAMFRLGRKASLILVNEKVKKALERAKLQGPALVEAEGFST